jgi:predicted AlkP superfamily pyrophosphatase or phosphodiesterase
MKRIISFVIYINIFSSFVNAQSNLKIPPEKPKLIVGIVVEQMRYDYLYKFWDKFGEGGFKRLMSEGTDCKNANYNYQFTQNSVGHATIATGTTPTYHGIVAEEWYLRLKDKVANCVADDKEKGIGGFADEGRMSPRQLLTTTIGDEMRLSNFNKSKVVGVSLNGSAAILSAGHIANAAYWFDGESGNWITSSYYMQDLPAWVKEFNNKKIADTYMTQSWNPKLPFTEYFQRCLPDDNKYESGIQGRKTFPYNLVEMGGAAKNKRRYNLLKTTPFGNTFTKDFAISAIVNDSLGRDNYTDLLMVTFAATENIGQNFGPESIEVMDAFIRLDENIEHFLNFLDQELGKQNVLVFLTSDHGVAQNPEYLADKGISVGYFSQNAALGLLRSYMNVVYGKGEWIKNYYAQQIYLNQDLIENSKLNLADVQQKIAQFMIQFTGVANAVSSTTLQTANFSEGIFSKMQKGFNQKRSGDVLINLEPGWIEKNGTTTTHNSSYSYDTHVPLIWYGWKVKRASIFQPVDIMDIAPSISYFLNIASPNATMGKPILELISQ